MAERRAWSNTVLAKASGRAGGPSAGSLGEDLVGVVAGGGHDGEHVGDEVVGDAGVEQVAHGVDEDHAGAAASAAARWAWGWAATPNPGPEVGGRPSVWYLAWPMAFKRLARVRA